MEAQAKSFKSFTAQNQKSLVSYVQQLKSLSDEMQSLQNRLVQISKEEINIINEKSSLQSSLDKEKGKLDQGRAKLATLRQEMFKEMAVQQSLILHKEKLCNAWSTIKHHSLTVKQCWNI